ncbi:hypothetical protein L1049_019191 [Liquidambar formosana]|uniref:DUF8040 domain-containing protein n=1 Tax=Liquidambar formosana TaxID=63359 RepID=A0AAP0RB61_LIQFO
MDIIDQLDEFVDEWDKKRRIVAQLVAYLVYYYRICKHANIVDRMIKANDQIKDRERRRNELMYDIRTSESSHGLICMSPKAFETLCNILRTSGRLIATRRVTIEEQVATFLYMLGQNDENIIAEVDRELENGTRPREALRYQDNDDEDVRQGTIIRDNITAAMWNNYARPKAKKWMKPPIPHYDKLSRIFGKDRATGLGATTAKEKVRQWVAESKNDEDDGEGGNSGNIIDDINQMMTDEFVMLQNIDDMNDEEIFPTIPHEGTSAAPDKSTSLTSKKRKAKSLLDEEKLNKAGKEIAVAIKEGNEILKDRNDILKMSIERSQPHVYKEEEVYDELMRLGVNREIRIKAYNFLIENPTKVKAVFGCPIEDHVQFLIFQLQKAKVI